MEMESCFSTVVHVGNMSNSDQLIAAVSDLNVFTDKELHEISKKVDGKKYVIFLFQERKYGTIFQNNPSLKIM